MLSNITIKNYIFTNCKIMREYKLYRVYNSRKIFLSKIRFLLFWRPKRTFFIEHNSDNIYMDHIIQPQDKIFVSMSGGVDSSVAAALLKNKSSNIFFFLQFFFLFFPAPKNIENRQCIRNFVPSNTLVTILVNVSGSPDDGQKVNMWITDIYGNEYSHFKNVTGRKKIIFTTSYESTIIVCLNNILLDGSNNTFYSRSIELDINKGTDALNWENIEMERHLKPVEVELLKIDGISREIAHEIKEIVYKMNDTNVDTIANYDASELSNISGKSRLGHYAILKTLGEGSFGKVKLAVHSVTGHKVALKIISRKSLLNLDMSSRVDREISYLKLLRHPHIIKLYEMKVFGVCGLILVAKKLLYEKKWIIVEEQNNKHDRCISFSSFHTNPSTENKSTFINNIDQYKPPLSNRDHKLKQQKKTRYL
ncbi:hypothetical protein PCK2_000508 [Pneumocystis canis]|nr:hypothetical protein PCK2_000508 [Pneumocystis canis]